MFPASRSIYESIRATPVALRELFAMYRFRQLFQRLRNRTYQGYFQTWCLWYLCAGAGSLAIEVIIVVMPPLALGKALVHLYMQQQISPIDYIVVFFWVTGGLLGYLIFKFLRARWADEFIQVHAYSHFYQCSRRLSPQQLNRCRFSQMVLLHPQLFSYAFSGQVMVVKIGRGQSHPVQLLEEADDGQEAVVSSPVLIEPDESPGQAEVISEKPSIAVEKPIEMQAVSSEPQEKEEEVNTISAMPTEAEMTPQEASTSERPAATSRKQQRPVVLIRQGILELHITIGQRVSLSLEEAEPQQNGETEKRQVEVVLNNSVYLAIVAYLATREKGALVSRDILLKAVYGEVTEGIAKRFNNDMRRIRQTISAQIRQTFPDFVSKEEGAKENSFEPFENKVTHKTESYWRLDACCRIVGVGDLRRWYQDINVARVHARKAEYTIEHLQTISQRLIKRYSKNYLYGQSNEEAYTAGYLIKHLSEDTFKHWAPDFYKDCREKYLAILKYIASCQGKLFTQTQDPAWAKSAAQLYKECAYAATCERIDHAQGEDALRKCIEMFMHDNDVEAAEKVYDIYNRRIKNALSEWLPERKTLEVLDKYGMVSE